MELEYLNFTAATSGRSSLRTFGSQAVVEEFYTDSLFDQPMIDLAEKAYLVKEQNSPGEIARR